MLPILHGQGGNEMLGLYNKVRQVPKEAQKPIKGGRLNGYTDINPMWRIKALTEQFGPCGIGWKYEITKQWLEEGAEGQVSAFTNINLYIKHEDKWSEAIPGTGGSMYVAKERGGLYTSDECFKMSLTDAISVSCKALGFGADIYWSSDRSKYDKPELKPEYAKDKPKTQDKTKAHKDHATITKTQALELFQAAEGDKGVVREVLDIFAFKNTTDVPEVQFKAVKKVIKDTYMAKLQNEVDNTPLPFK